MKQKVQLKPLVNLIHQLHLATINSDEDPTPIIGEWSLTGSEKGGWQLLIPAWDIVPYMAPILEILGFRAS